MTVRRTVTRAAGALLGAAVAAAGSLLAAAPAGAAIPLGCVDRTATARGTAPWQVRQASGLTTTAGSPGVLWTHNDRGIRDSPVPGEDVTSATLWAMAPSGGLLARYRLVRAPGDLIAYHDTEAVSRDLQGRIVLADTGNNVDPRTVVHLYRAPAPTVVPTQDLVDEELPAEVVPVSYFSTADSTTPLRLNVEAVFVDAGGNAWFVPRSKGRVPFYVATAEALDQAALSGAPARAVQAGRTGVSGPFTDASLSPSGDLLVLKTTTDVWAYDLTGVRTVSGTAAALAAPSSATGPCSIAYFPRASYPGRGEAVVVDDGGGFWTLAESPKDATRSKPAVVYEFG